MASVSEMAEELAKRIAGRVEDPAGWLIEARRTAEALRLDVTRCLPVPGTLRSICFAIADEARKQGVPDDAIWRA